MLKIEDKLWVELRHIQTKAPTEGVVLRRPHMRVGWEWVWYKKRRYQIFGGCRNPEFIDLDNPIPKRIDS